MDLDFAVNSNEIIHTCEGYIGEPAGNFIIEVNQGNSSSFTQYSQYYNPGTTTSSKDNSICNTQATHQFGLQLPASFNGSTIRCRAENDLSISSGDNFVSNVERIDLIPGNFLAMNSLCFSICLNNSI